MRDTAERLTSREREVASLAAAGLTYTEISARLFVSVNTVRTHLRHIYAKLGVRNKVALADALHRLDTR